jgi:hypothetical protein
LNKETGSESFPDIEVDNDSALEFAGDDGQLNSTLEEIKKALAANPVRIPAPPAYPDKKK